MLNYHLTLSGTQRKKNITENILNTPQQNKGVVNVHRVNPKNVGDFYCAPHLYFDKLKTKQLDISDVRSKNRKKTKNFIDKISNNSLIIGGGGLLNIKYFQEQMHLFEALAKKGKKIVLWGTGHNEIDLEAFKKSNKYWIDIKQFGLSGTRDYSNTEKDYWLPCVSCMHSVFDKNYEIQHDIGLLFNHKSIKDNNLKAKYKDYPISSNTTNLEQMVAFIGMSETIVTNSYHAMYWAILLKRKVIAIPTTSKFLDFKYKVPISSFDNFKSKLNETKVYNGVLDECRKLNNQFAEKAFDYLEL